MVTEYNHFPFFFCFFLYKKITNKIILQCLLIYFFLLLFFQFSVCFQLIPFRVFFFFLVFFVSFFHFLFLKFFLLKCYRLLLYLLFFISFNFSKSTSSTFISFIWRGIGIFSKSFWTPKIEFCCRQSKTFFWDM